MNRRDIIIISVLLNASLLAVLFFMARNGEEEKFMEQVEIVQEVAAVPQIVSTSITAKNQQLVVSQSKDEIDDVLRDYAVPLSSLATLDEESEKEEDSDVFTLDVLRERESQSDRYVEVTVKRGDALEKIARANGTTVEAIKKLNRLNTEKVFVGQILRIPIGEKKSDADPKSSLSSRKTEDSSKVLAEAEYYVIKSGDNPWKIAKLYHVKFDELLRLNDLNEEKARNLKVGDKIRVR